MSNSNPSTIDEPMPRYSTLTLCIRAALFSADHPLVQHMARRNHELDEQKAIEQQIAAMSGARA